MNERADTANGALANDLASETARNSSLYNEDLAAVPKDKRSWGIYN